MFWPVKIYIIYNVVLMLKTPAIEFQESTECLMFVSCFKAQFWPHCSAHVLQHPVWASLQNATFYSCSPLVLVLIITGGKVTSSQSSLRAFSTSSSTVTFLLVLMVPSTSWWRLWTLFSFICLITSSPRTPVEGGLCPWRKWKVMCWWFRTSSNTHDATGEMWWEGGKWKKNSSGFFSFVFSLFFFLVNVLCVGGDVYYPTENMQIVWNELF